MSKEFDSVVVETFEKAYAMALCFKSEVGWMSYPLMWNQVIEVAKKLPREQVQTILAGSRNQEYGKTFSEVRNTACEVYDVANGCPIVTIANIKKSSIDFLFVNVSKEKVKVHAGISQFEHLSCCVKPSLMSSEGLVNGKEIEEFVLGVKGRSKVLPGRSSAGQCALATETLYSNVLLFSLRRVRNGSIDIRTNLNVDGVEWETRAHLLFDADIRS